MFAAIDSHSESITPFEDALKDMNKGEYDASRNILYGESSAESSDSEFGELGQRKTCKSTRMSFEAEDYVDFDDFPIVFYEPKA